MAPKKLFQIINNQPSNKHKLKHTNSKPPPPPIPTPKAFANPTQAYQRPKIENNSIQNPKKEQRPPNQVDSTFGETHLLQSTQNSFKSTPLRKFKSKPRGSQAWCEWIH
ncbi:hypothetical protein JTB14_007509 [Gonioctena quinquepunctata]|nr:hypothetical protein JTB14_007509 [Gonioctena quinquepunctata]